MYKWLFPLLFSEVEVEEEEGWVTCVWPAEVDVEVEVPVAVVLVEVNGACI